MFFEKVFRRLFISFFYRVGIVCEKQELAGMTAISLISLDL